MLIVLIRVPIAKIYKRISRTQDVWEPEYVYLNLMWLFMYAQK